MHANQDQPHAGHPRKGTGHQGNGHSHGHGLVNGEAATGRRLLITLALNFIIPVVQIAGGLVANSMALISDAIHNLSDFTAILISYIAFRIGRRGASVTSTFGYQRAEIMAALLNVTILTCASAFIVYGAAQRLLQPVAVSGLIVVLAAGAAILGNGVSAWLLHRDSQHDLNVRSAFLHMLGDFLFSVAVLISGVVFLFKPWFWLDPLLSILIVLFIMKNCWSIIRESTAVLMNATPKGFDLHEIKDCLEGIPGVAGVHYLHLWKVSSASVAFSCHVVVPDQALSLTEELSWAIHRTLLDDFGIDHPVLQFETGACGNGSLLCEVSCNGDNGNNSIPPGAK